MLSYAELNNLYLQLKEKYYVSDQLFDKHYQGQYHISCFVLMTVNSDEDIQIQNEIITLCLEALAKEWTMEKNRYAADFTLENLCWAHYTCSSIDLKSKIREFLLNHSYVLNVNIDAYANDYYLLRYFNYTYFIKFLSLKFTIPVDLENKVRKVCSTDGILADTFVNCNAIPDLAYHSRNLQILLGIYLFNPEEFVASSIQRAVEFIYQYSCNNGRFCVYGRTSGLVYGYASLFMALHSVGVDKVDAKFLKLRDVLLHEFIDRKNSLIFVTAAGKGDVSRRGFDSYVYPMVYKLFACSRIFLISSNKTLTDINVKISELDTLVVNSQYDESTGFLVARNDGMEKIVNLIGHPDAPIRSNDSRYFPLQILNCTSVEIPSAGIYYAESRPQSNFHEKLIRKYKDFKNKLFKDPSVGFLPNYLYQNKKFLISKYEVQKMTDRNFCLKPIFITGAQVQTDIFSKLLCFVKLGKQMEYNFILPKNVTIEYPIFHFVHDEICFKDNLLFLNNEKIVEFSSSVDTIRQVPTIHNSVNGRSCQTIVEFDQSITELKVIFAI